jgi:phosphopantothenoylcysteine decarboxylase/phosphopantothenate--cysteine ligase
MVAAVADFRPASRADGKIRRSSGLESIPVESCPDLLAGTSERASADCVKVAFAVELGEGGEESAHRKLEEKDAHLIVLNDPSEPGAGFGVETNRVKIIDRTGEVETLPLILKTEVADEVIDRAEKFLPA